ncbi:MAG: hypothetical protein K2X87_00845 [Gemmataceae bacterium]|nr:hypothetical protein [Gemmataceae bacterium]
MFGRNRWFGAVVAVLAVAAPPPAVAQAPPPTIEQILKVWAARQEKARTLRIVWESKRTLPKGINDLTDGGRTAGGRPNPPEDLLLDEREELTIAGDRLRFDSVGKGWSADDQAVKPFNLRYAVDGDRYVNGIVDDPNAPHGAAFINRLGGSDRAEVLHMLSLAPVLQTFRGAASPLNPMPIDDYEVTGRRAAVNGRPCLELLRTSRSEDRRECLLLDAERDFVIVRRYTVVKNQTVSMLNVTYAPNAAVGWTPSAWDDAIQTVHKRPLGSGRHRVTATEFNGDVPAATFDPTFKPGTRVIDMMSPGASRQFVVREDGSPGEPVVVGERQAWPTYEQVVRASQVAPRNRNWWLIGVGGGVVALCCVLVVWRLRAGRGRAPTPPGASTPPEVV